MKDVRETTQFRKDLRLAGRRGCDVKKFTAVLDRLRAGYPLAPAQRDHALKGGEWRGCRECQNAESQMSSYGETDNKVGYWSRQQRLAMDLRFTEAMRKELLRPWRAQTSRRRRARRGTFMAMAMAILSASSRTSSTCAATR
jgi:addiction module RelE/StbE family toxin